MPSQCLPSTDVQLHIIFTHVCMSYFTLNIIFSCVYESSVPHVPTFQDFPIGNPVCQVNWPLTYFIFIYPHMHTIYIFSFSFLTNLGTLWYVYLKSNIKLFISLEIGTTIYGTLNRLELLVYIFINWFQSDTETNFTNIWAIEKYYYYEPC